MKQALIAALALIALGCGSKKAADKSTSDPKAAYDKMADFAHQMCKCADMADAAAARSCGEKVDAAQDTWEDGLQVAMDEGTLKIDDETMTMLDSAKNDFRDCRTKSGAEKQ